MRKLFLIMALLLPSVARAQLTQSQINGIIASDIPSCGTGCVNAQDVRNVLGIMNQATFQFTQYPNIYTAPQQFNATMGVVNGTTPIFGVNPATPFTTVNSRSLFTAQSGAPVDWLPTYSGATYGQFGEIVSLSGIGDVGVVGASRTTDITTAMRLPIGVLGFSFNFATSGLGLVAGWGGNFDARRITGAGGIQGLEVNATELGSTAAVPTPYAITNFTSVAGWFGSGSNCTSGAGGCYNGTVTNATATNASLAIGIFNNGAAFEKGIVAQSTAFDGSLGNGGAGIYMEAARGQSIRWLNSGNTTDAEIWSNSFGLNIGFGSSGVDAISNTLFFIGQGTVQMSSLPSSAGSGGLYVCRDNTGVLYTKSSCP